MSFDLSDTAAAYCDASVGTLKLRGGSLYTTYFVAPEPDAKPFGLSVSTIYRHKGSAIFFFLFKKLMETGVGDLDKLLY